MQNVSRFATRAVVALLVVLLAACAGSAVKPTTPEEQVRLRSQERWSLMIARDFNAAYQYLTPGTRLLQSLEDFNEKYRHTRVDWKSVEVTEVLCETADRCAVKVDVTFGIVGGMRGVPNVGGNQVANEVWLLEGGTWYYLPGN